MQHFLPHMWIIYLNFLDMFNFGMTIETCMGEQDFRRMRLWLMRNGNKKLGKEWQGWHGFHREGMM